MRDVNLEKYLRKIGNDFKTLPYTRFARSMAGEEFARVYAWGKEPVADVTIFRNSFLSSLTEAGSLQKCQSLPTA